MVGPFYALQCTYLRVALYWIYAMIFPWMIIEGHAGSQATAPPRTSCRLSFLWFCHMPPPAQQDPGPRGLHFFVILRIMCVHKGI
jgi:hypothetical protein